MNGIQAFNAAYNQVLKAGDHVRAVQESRVKAQRDEELYKLKKQEAEISLKKAKTAGIMTENDYQIQTAQMKEYFKQLDQINKGKTAQINMAESQAVEQGKQAQGVMQELVQTDPDVQGLVQGYQGVTNTTIEPYYSGGHYGFKPRKQTAQAKVTGADKALGALESGGVVDDQVEGGFVEFKGRKEAERYANENLGYGWKNKFPQVGSILDSKYGPDVNKFKQELQSKGISNIRQAHQYLVDVKGMDPEKAKQWLEENN